MDTAEEFAAVEFCAGYGGIQLGLQRAIPNLRLAAACEIEAFAVANLVAKMEAGLLDPAPIWPDVKTFPCEPFRDRVDLLVAGYPCQPFSQAGQRKGHDDPRHLWPHIRKAIGIIRPQFCFFENVEGHISLGLSTIVSDLAADGYRTSWGIFSAVEVGAPHQRKRVFILAHSAGSGLQKHKQQSGTQSETMEPSQGQKPAGICQIWPSRPGEPQHAWEPPRTVADRKPPRKLQPERSIGNERRRKKFADSSEGQTQSPVGRGPDGAPDRMGYAELCVSCDNRTDELRLLGNGVVPAVAEKAWRTLLAELTEGETP